MALTAEEIAASPYFDADAYVEAKARIMVLNGKANSHEDAKAQFLSKWTGDMSEHYLNYGAAENVNPSNDFDNSDYIAQVAAADGVTYQELKADWEAQGIAPLEHFIETGEALGYTAPPVSEDEQVDVGDTPVVEGDDILLTSDTDRGGEFDGTSGDDTFDAPIVQNQWAGGVSNSLSTADRINGGDGEDSLHAELVPEFFGVTGDNEMEIQPRITTVENITFEALDPTSTEGDKAITIDAKNITDVDKIGSKFSDGDLVIENLTTRAAGSYEPTNTNNITVTMDHTDNFNSDGDASDLTVLFDEDYLTTGTEVQGSQLTINMINTLNNRLNEVNGDSALSLIEGFEQFTFNVGEKEITVVVDGAELSEVKGLIEQALTDADIDTVTVTEYLEPAFFATNIYYEDTDTTYNAGDPAGPDYTAFRLTNSASDDLTEGGFNLADGSRDGSLAYSQDDREAQIDDLPISINVELEKVGRDGEGGNLIIGGKDQNLNGDSDVDQNDGIEIFNITVLGGEDKPSNLGVIMSTNGALDIVNIASEANTAEDATFASLTVRGAVIGENDTAPFGGTLTTLDADNFLGDLFIGEDTAAFNIDTFTAQGGGDVTLYAEYYTPLTGVNEDVETAWSVTTGAGDDTLVLDIDGDMVDAKGESFAVSTGAGDDDITVDVDDFVSQGTMAELENLSIDSGAGNDEINLMNIGNWDVDAGAGDDTVYVANNGNDTERDAVNEVQTITFGEAGDLDTQGEVTVTFSDGSVVTTAGANSIATDDSAVDVAGKVEDQITAAGIAGLTAIDNADGTITLTYTAAYDGANPDRDVASATVEGIVTDALMTSTADADAAGASSTFAAATTENITLTFTDQGAAGDIVMTFGDDLAGGGATTVVTVTDTDGNGDVTAFEQAEQVAAATYNNWDVVSSNPSLGTVTLEANTAADMDDFSATADTITYAVNTAGTDETAETGTGGSTETLTVAGGADQAGQLTLEIDVDGSGDIAADGSETFSINVSQGNEVDVAADVAAGINAIAGLSATHAANSNDVVVTYDAIGAAADFLDITVTDGAVRSATVAETTKGLEASEAMPATWLVNYNGTDIVDNDHTDDTADATPMDAGALDLLFGATLTVTYSGATTDGASGVIAGAAVATDNGYESTVTIDTDNYVGNYVNINDAIMEAIIGDGVNGGESGANVLEELLTVRESNLEGLIIESVIDGEFNEADLAITMTAADVEDMTNSQKAGLVAALQMLDGDSDAEYTDVEIQNRLDAAVDAFTTSNALDNLAMATSDGITLLAGEAGDTENDSTIELGTGDDVIVLSTNGASNNTLVYENFDNGHDTVVNFTEAGAAMDMIDFSSYLNAQTSASGSDVTAVDYAQTLNTDTTADLDEVTIINDFAQDLGDLTTNSDDETWAGLDADKLLAALHNDNTDADDAWGNIQEADLDVASITDLVGDTYNHIVMVENDLNDGEYKVYNLVAEDATDNADADFTSVQLIGIIDFGDTLANVTDANFA